MNKYLEKIYLIKNKKTGNYIGNSGSDDNLSPCLFTKESHAKLKIQNKKKRYNSWEIDDFEIVSISIKLDLKND